jgi:hypothetical protein
MQCCCAAAPMLFTVVHYIGTNCTVLQECCQTLHLLRKIRHAIALNESLLLFQLVVHKQTYDDVVGWKDPENNDTTIGESLTGTSLLGESASALEVDKLSSVFVDTSNSIGGFVTACDTLGVTVDDETSIAVLSDTAAVDTYLARSSSSSAAVTTPKHTAVSNSTSSLRAAKATALVQKVSTSVTTH